MIRMILPALICICAVYAVMYYSAKVASTKDKLSESELLIIRESGKVMYVLQISDPLDSITLRTASKDMPEDFIGSEDYKLLGRKMLSTVEAPCQGGVGIAAPQVGINRRLIAVKRYDKAGEPFELYPNIRIDRLFGPEVKGPEGCLSIPPYRGEVLRRDSVLISYLDTVSMQRRVEALGGYTAIIFQHECDHLDGILYTDCAENVTVNEAWAEERKAFEGEYGKPEFLEKIQKETVGK